MYIRFPCTFHAKNSIVSKCPNIFPRYIGSAPSGERFTFATTVSATMRYAAHVTRRIYIQFDHLSFMAAILDECCHFADWIFSAVICFYSIQNKQQNVTEQKIKCRFLRWHGSIRKKTYNGRKRAEIRKKECQYSMFEGENVRFNIILIGMKASTNCQSHPKKRTFTIFSLDDIFSCILHIIQI